jgi:uncharacterized protein
LKEKIRLLITLQDFDVRMGVISAQKEEGPQKIRRLEQRLTDVETALTEQTSQLDGLTRERRETDQKIEEAENKIKKADIKLSNIKSNKEYHAALKEIDELKKAKYLLEEKAIEIMEKLEVLEKECRTSKGQAEEMRRQFETVREAVARSLGALDQELDTLQQDRMEVSQGVDTGLLKRYDMLRERKGGIAVSPVVQGVCQTCHIKIPPQEFNELIRGDKLMACPNCTRIIYWGDDDHFKADAGDE